MKRWLLISLLVIGLLLLSTSCSEETPTAPEPYLTVTDQGAVSCIDTTIKELVIPDYINGIKVTSIADNGFRECKSLESITISESVTSIGKYAFYGCSSLEEITIPDSVTSICDFAFYGCSELTSISIPESVTSIGENAFTDCSALEEININKTEDSISGAPWGASDVVIKWKTE